MKGTAMKSIHAYRKAILAFLLPFGASVGAAMQDGSLTVSEVVVAAGFGIVTGVAVYAIPNTPSADRRV